jgi:DNA-binding ferritin-like protein
VPAHLSNRFLGAAKVVNCFAMNPHYQRADVPTDTAGHISAPGFAPPEDILDLSLDEQIWNEPQEERDSRGAGGRAVLGTALTLLAALWVGFAAWSAGRVLASEPLSSPAIAQWVAIAAGPLALLGLAWILFGRSRRRETERFTRSVVAMRNETHSLEALLAVLSQRIEDSQAALGRMAERLMRLGDETTGRFDGITRELDSSTERMTRSGMAMDRAAEFARNDIAVLLEDLPRAETTTRAIAEQLRGIGSDSAARTAEFGQQVTALADRTRETDEMVGGAAQRLVTHLTQIESAGAAAATRVGDAETSFSGALDTLLDRTARTLEEIRSGIDAQSAAVSALVRQASAGIGRAGVEAADVLGTKIGEAGASLDGLSARVAEQERVSQRMFAEIDRGLTLIDGKFAELASQGVDRANHFLGSLARARGELDALTEQTGTQDHSIEALATRTGALRQGIDELAREIREGLSSAIGEAETGADRMLRAAETAKPEISWMRDAAIEAGAQIAASGAGIAEQQDRMTALLATIDDGVGNSQGRLAELSTALAEAQGEASRLTAETGPALVAALLQVREAAAHAAERAREAIEGVIPQSAGKLSAAARDALEQVIRESIEERLRGVEAVAARAVTSAAEASDRLTQQMLTLGHSSAALEQYFEKSQADQREKDSEAFARRVALLMDSMNSAAIDVGKILSDEIDDKAWTAYLKGNRGVFTRRAVRLLGGTEIRAIEAHYETDGEFQASVNRYVHDFEAMLRRVLAERDGGMMAVTLMSSDMGKLYAALSQAIERRR